MAQVGLADEVHVRSEFVVPVQDIKIIGVEAEGPRHVEVPWEECEQNSNGKAEPKDGGSEQKVIVAIDGCRDPSRGDDRIDGLLSAKSESRKRR